MHAGRCRHERLASGRCCQVDLCDHGVAHVSIGPFRLRLTHEQLRAVAKGSATHRAPGRAPSAGTVRLRRASSRTRGPGGAGSRALGL